MTKATVRHVDDSNESTIQLSKVCQVQAKTIWRSGEVPWTSADALSMQNPWVLVNHAVKRNLQHYPDFKWTTNHASDDEELQGLAQQRAMAVKRQQEPRFKFGVQVPQNATHADVLDDASNSNLWAVSKQKEVESLRAFKTFRAVDEGEEHSVPLGV